MNTEPELPRALALAWGVAAAPQRGPKREMSIERIVEAAVEIADASGLGAVSMAAVAAKFSMTPMALYRYVSAKDDLVMLMYEQGVGAPPLIEEHLPWQAAIEVWARANFAALVAHPWMLDVPIEGPPLTPNGLAWADAGVFALRGSGLQGGELLSAILAVSGQVQWMAQLHRSRDGKPSAVEADLDHLFNQLITKSDYPWYHDALLGDGPPSEPFAFGLAALIDGFTAAAAGRATRVDPVESLPEAVRSDRRYRDAQSRRKERERELQRAVKEERQALRDAKRAAFGKD